MAEKQKMSVVLASKAVAELGKSLSLTNEQQMKAKSSALKLSSDPKLRNCDPYSLIKYCFEVARYNFTRDDSCYPVPYGNLVQVQMGYKGLREIAMRSNKYDEITCTEVYDCDKIIRDRETGQIRVEFNEDYLATQNAKLVGFFAFARTKEGKISNSLFWTVEQCEKHGRHYSKTYNSIWNDKEFGFVKMAKKTVIKQLCNELDQTPELREVLGLDQIVIGKEGQEDKYLDNPQNDIFDGEIEQKESTITNSILPTENEETGEVEEVYNPNHDNDLVDL